MSGVVLHWPGDSWLHRTPVGGKALALVAASTGLVVWGGPWSAGALAVAAVVVARAVGLPARVLRAAMTPFVVTAFIMWAWQMAMGAHAAAWVSSTRVLALSAVAVTLTLTTPATDVVDAVERALLRLRVRSDRVFRLGLTVGITIRSVGHLAVALDTVRDARRARGLGRSLRALAVPTVVSAGRLAHGVGEALEARGIADPDGEHPE